MINPRKLKAIAWTIWAGFLACCLGLFAIAQAEKSDVYFVRYYRVHSMDAITSAVIMHGAWIAGLPFLFLLLVVSYHRKTNPTGKTLLFLIGAMFMAGMVVTGLLFRAGPGFQM